MFKAVRIGCAIAAASLLLPASAHATETKSLVAFAGCSSSNVEAAVLHGYPPEFPSIARIMDIAGTTYVKVEIAASGAPENISLWKSSGYRVLDREALAATRRASFRPASFNCAPVSGSYLYAVEFAR